MTKTVRPSAMIEKWLHLMDLGGDPWVLPIWTAVHGAIQSGKATKIPENLGQLGLYISIRLNLLPRVLGRINEEIKELYEVAKNHRTGHIFSNDSDGVAFDVENNLKYNLIIDIDSLLFELNSVCELMSKLFEHLYKHAGKSLPKKNVGGIIKKVLEEANGNSKWFILLDNHRNFFIHKGAPYLAIDISAPSNYDLLIIKENIKQFNDPEKFIRLSELSEIVQGFYQAKITIQEHLISLFK